MMCRGHRYRCVLHQADPVIRDKLLAALGPTARSPREANPAIGWVVLITVLPLYKNRLQHQEQAAVTSIPPEYE